MSKREQRAVRAALESLSVERLLARVSQMAPLGDSGVLAGQALASAVYAELGINSNAPMNDADVFVSVASDRYRARVNQAEGRQRNISRTASHVGACGVDFTGGQYAHMSSYAKKGYDIRGTDRDGLLNTVFYSDINQWLNRDRQSCQAALVIEAFDFNCVQVGIDLAVGKLVWTEAFERFLCDWQLRVANVATPFHTAVRYFKKKADLGAHGNDALEMAVCALPSEAFGMFDSVQKSTVSSYVAVRYGSKVHENYLSVKDQIEPWFKETRIERYRVPIYTMAPTFDAAPELLAKIRNFPKRASEFGLSELRLDCCESLLVATASRIGEALVLPESVRATERRAKAVSALSSVGGSDGAGASFSVQSFQGDRWLGKEDLSASDLTSLSKFLNDHSAFVAILWGLPLRRQCEAAAELRRQEAARGPKVYGWIEASHRARDFRADKVAALFAGPDFSELDAFFEMQSLGGSRILAEPLPLKAMSSLALACSRKILGIEFQELLCNNDLEEEGRALRHCVGGYGGAIESGRSRIIRVLGEDGPDRSTAEISVPSDKQPPRIVQHRAFANGTPSQKAFSAMRMVAESYGSSREESLFSTAAILCRALETGAVPDAKLRAAGGLLRAALKKSETAGRRGAGLAKSIRETLDADPRFAWIFDPAKPVPRTAAKPSA